MKVLQVLDCFYPNVDGPIDVMVSLARKYKEHGLCETELLVPSYPENVQTADLTVHRCFSFPSNENYRAAMPFLDKKVKKLIKKGGFDIVHIHSPFLLGRYALKYAHKCGIPVVFTMHTKFRDEFERRIKSGLIKKFVMNYIMKCIDGCDAVTTVSKGTVDTLGEYGYKDCENVRVIRNATSMTDKFADPEKVAELKKQLGIEDKFAFLFVGRLVEAKNIQFSIRVLSKVKKQGYNDFKFIIVGDGDYAKALKKLAAEEGLEENVVFAGRITDRNTLANYYSACDTLLFPSVFDNASIVIMESAANGLPVATIKDSCSAELLVDGESGFVWENSEQSWVENVKTLLDEPQRAKTAGEGAKRSVYTDWDEIARQYMRLYEEQIALKISFKKII